MTIYDRLLNTVGSYKNPPFAQTQLDESVREVFGDLPEEVLLPMASKETDDGTGVDVANKKIISAHKSGYPAERLRYDLVDRFTTTDPGEGDPAYYVDPTTNKAYVVPSGGTLMTLSYPAIKLQDEAPTDIPLLLVDVIVSRAAIKLIDNMMGKIRNDLGLSVTLPEAPVVPELPEAPSFSTGSVSATSVAATSVAAAAVESFNPVPTYLDSVFEGDATIPAGLPTIDFSQDVSGNPISPPTAPTAPDTPNILSIGIETPTIGSVPSAPDFSRMSGLAQDFAKFNQYRDNEEPQMMAGILEAMALELQQRSLNVQDELNRFNSEMDKHQLEVNKAIEQARLILQEHTAELDANLQAQVQDWQGKLGIYQGQLQGYQTEMTVYVQNIETVVREWEALYREKIDPWVQQNQIAVSVFGAKTSARVNQFQAEISQWSSDAQAKLEKAQIKLQENLAQAQIDAQKAETDAQLATNIALQNQIRTDQMLIEEYSAKLERFVADLNRFGQRVGVFQATVQKILAEKELDIGIRKEKLRMMNFDRNRVIEEYSKKRMSYIRYYWPHRSYTIQQPVI